MPEWLPAGTILGLCGTIVVLARIIYVVMNARIAEIRADRTELLNAINNNTRSTDDLTAALKKAGG